MRFFALLINATVPFTHRADITYPHKTLIIPDPDIARLVLHSIHQFLLVFFNALALNLVPACCLHSRATQLLQTLLATQRLQTLLATQRLQTLFTGHVLVLVFKKGEFIFVRHLCHQLTVLPYPPTDALLVDEILPSSSDVAVIELANIFLTRLEKQVPLAMFFKILHFSIIHISRRVLDLDLAHQLVPRPLP
jgi:hypothetical protein